MEKLYEFDYVIKSDRDMLSTDEWGSQIRGIVRKERNLRGPMCTCTCFLVGYKTNTKNDLVLSYAIWGDFTPIYVYYCAKNNDIWASELHYTELQLREINSVCLGIL